MGENWDWAACIEKITILNHITRPDGHRILTMTEPGIIGKVGMNSAGIGVGLNFIPGTARSSGIPVHIILRACLEASCFEHVSEMMDELARKNLLGTMSAITVMDKHGNAEMFEILGSELVRTRRVQDPIFVHTNHPLLNPSSYGTVDLESSLSRLHVARSLAAKGPLAVDALAGILADRSDEVHSINMQPQSWGAIGSVGTIRSLIFDLENGTFYISKGTPGELSGPIAYDHVKIY
jgi:isopenicillin-N N-acyltransferase-like protein